MTKQAMNAGRALANLSAGRPSEGLPDLSIPLRKEDDPATIVSPLPATAPAVNQLPQTGETTSFDAAAQRLVENVALPKPNEEARVALGITQTPPGAATTVATPAAQGGAPSPETRILIDLNDPSAVFLTPDGRQLKGSDVVGEMMLKRDYSREKMKVQQTGEDVKRQEEILKLAAASPLVATYLQAKRAGATEENAVRAGLDASGYVAPEAVVEPEIPREDDPDFQKKFWARQQYEIETKTNQAVEAHMKRLIPQQVSSPVANPEEGENVAYNNRLVDAYLGPHLPANMTPEQQAYLVGYIQSVATAEEVSLDFKERKLTAGEVKLIERSAFPFGQLPPAIEQELGRRAAPTTYVPGYVPPAYAPTTALPNTVTLQHFQQLSQENRELKEKLGLAPPSVPSSPVSQASAPSTALPPTQSAGGMFTPKGAIIREMLANIPRK